MTGVHVGRPGILIFPAGRRFLSFPNIRTDSGVHKFSYAMGTGGCYPEVKLSVCEVDQLHLMPSLGRSGDTPPPFTCLHGMDNNITWAIQ